MNDSSNEIAERDVATLRVLGIFFSIMGVLVLIGTFEAVGKTAAVIVSICSGMTLLTIGLCMWRVSQRWSKKLRS